MKPSNAGETSAMVLSMAHSPSGVIDSRWNLSVRQLCACSKLDYTNGESPVGITVSKFRFKILSTDRLGGRHLLLGRAKTSGAPARDFKCIVNEKRHDRVTSIRRIRPSRTAVLKDASRVGSSLVTVVPSI